MRRVSRFASTLRAPRDPTVVPHCVGTRTRSCTAMKWNHHSYPRGPRSCPSYAVSGHHHLIDPIRPTRGHIAISPRSGLYAMSSLCGSAEATREWFRAFAADSFLTCRPLRPRGVRHRVVQVCDVFLSESVTRQATL